MVPIILPLVLALDIMIVVQGRRLVPFRRILPAIIAGALGSPVGNYVLLVAPSGLLRVVTSVVIIAFALFLLLGYTVTLRREKTSAGVAGFLGGVMATSIGVSGPPMTLFLLNQRWERDLFRCSMSSCLIPVNTVALVSLALSGVLTTSTLAVDLVLLPLALIGYAIALRVLYYLHSELFRRGAAILVIASGVSSIVTTLLRL